MIKFALLSVLMENKSAARVGIAICALPLFMVSTIWVLTQTTFAQKKVEVDLALILAVDVSYSVNNAEYRLQMQGLSRAFASQEVIALIRRCQFGRIAVMVVEWSGRRSQSIVVPWTIVSDAAAAQRVAQAISSAPRRFAGKTSISALIDFAVFHLFASPVNAVRHVIDVSADGVNNDGERPRFPRKRAIAAGVTINGLTILNNVNNLDVYFRQYIAAGPNNFVIKANDYEAYRTAIKRKLLREVECLAVS
ncbi:MAG: DUF1194 domain-containing protein [Hyphomicrobiaceae bacterium]